jgi:hypothetical protein
MAPYRHFADKEALLAAAGVRFNRLLSGSYYSGFLRVMTTLCPETEWMTCRRLASVDGHLHRDAWAVALAERVTQLILRAL